MSKDPNVDRNAIIFHGTGASPDVCWLPWLRDRLTSRGYAVDVPHYPGLNVDPIDTFLPTVLANHTFGADTVLVGHSGGAALLLALLQHLDVTVAQAILVAGYATEPNAGEEPVLQKHYDWAAIKEHVHELIFINSPADPYGCDDQQGRTMFDQLGGTLIIRNGGHYTDPTFELLNRLIN
jgi:predicted alpha/beta hydrolase family esterase